MRGRPLVFLATLLLLAGAQAQSVGITNPYESTATDLYFHLDTLQDFPINTQSPDDRYTKGSTRGILAPTTSCSPDGSPGQIHQSQHTLYGVSSPGYVEYDFQENQGPRTHPEKGIAADVDLDTATEMIGKWFLRTTVDSGRFGGGTAVGVAPNDLPIVVPEVVVKFTMRRGDDLSFGDELYNKGELIAVGQSAPVQMIPNADVTPQYHALPDGGHLYEFDVPMEIEEAVIEKDTAFNIRVDMFVNVPACNEDSDTSLMPGTVEIYTAPDYRPKLSFAIMNPIEIVTIHPQFVGNELYIHTSFTSPWGNYDVDEAPGGITVAIDGPTEAKSLVRSAFTQRHHEHDHHFEPVDVSYRWPYTLDGAERATYTINVEVWNDQRTGMATGEVFVDIDEKTAFDAEGNEVQGVKPEAPKESPGVGLVAVLGLLAVALLRRR